MYNISEKGNYLQIIAPDGTSYIGAKSDVRVIPNATNTHFTITSLSFSFHPEGRFIYAALEELADGNNVPFTLQAWEMFYQNNTAVVGSAGVGGSSNGLTDAQLRASAVPVTNNQLPSSLGQKSEVNSMSVALAAEQVNDLTVVGEANQTAVINNILTPVAGVSAADVQRYRSFQIQVNSTATAGTFIFEGSNDNVNFVAIPVKNTSLSSGDAIVLPITATASNIIYEGACMFRYIRLRIATTLTGGVIQAFSVFSANSYAGVTQIIGQGVAANNKTQAAQTGTWTVMPGNTANTTPWLINSAPSASFGYSTTHMAKNIGGSTMLTSVKASGGNINFITVSNNNASTHYFLKIYNKASAPVLSTDVPALVFRILPASTLMLPVKDLRLTTGIAYAVTGGVVDNDGTAITPANDIIVNINYV